MWIILSWGATPAPCTPLMTRWLTSALLLLLTLFLTLPVLALVASWMRFDAAAQDVLLQMAQTVLPGYTATTIGLCVAVAVGVAVVGMATASAVTLFDFPGRRVMEWALLLPLAMPAYVVAYAYTDYLQFSGPLQTALRESFGLRLDPRLALCQDHRMRRRQIGWQRRRGRGWKGGVHIQDGITSPCERKQKGVIRPTSDAMSRQGCASRCRTGDSPSAPA